MTSYIKDFCSGLIVKVQKRFCKKMFKILPQNKFLHDGKPSLAYLILILNTLKVSLILFLIFSLMNSFNVGPVDRNTKTTGKPCLLKNPPKNPSKKKPKLGMKLPWKMRKKAEKAENNPSASPSSKPSISLKPEPSATLESSETVPPETQELLKTLLQSPKIQQALIQAKASPKTSTIPSPTEKPILWAAPQSSLVPYNKTISKSGSEYFKNHILRTSYLLKMDFEIKTPGSHSKDILIKIGFINHGILQKLLIFIKVFWNKQIL